MTNRLTKQVEVQGMKKLDSLKGVQALNAKELREIDGGWGLLTFLIFAAVVIAIDYISDGELDGNVNRGR